MSFISYLPLIQDHLTRYIMTTYITLGEIGLLFNILIFSQSITHRRNPCSLYILAASICGLIGLNFSTVPVVYALDHPNPVTISLVFCALQFYFRHSFNQMMRTFFIFACADRYAISSNNIRIRSFSRYQIAKRVILCVPVFWFLLAILPVMLRTLQNGKCEGRKGVSAIIVSIYVAVSAGVGPLLAMIIFGLSMWRNLKNIRARIQPITGPGPVIHRLPKRDRDMLKMLLIEVMCYICTTTPLAINLVYQSATQTIIKSNEQLRIEAFIIYFTGTFLLYINNGVSFWIYIIASRSFRLEFKNVIIKLYERITCRQPQANVVN